METSAKWSGGAPGQQRKILSFGGKKVKIVLFLPLVWNRNERQITQKRLAFAQKLLKVFVMSFADKWKINHSVFPQAREIPLS